MLLPLLAFTQINLLSFQALCILSNATDLAFQLLRSQRYDAMTKLLGSGKVALKLCSRGYPGVP
jgi:hypothetical protein